MSELEHSSLGSSRDDGAPPSFEDLAGRLGDRSHVEREGLPQSYRMRAESHYVDHLESRYEGHAIRLIPIDDISTTAAATGGVEALARSIATHGVLQPLLVRRHNGSYVLIAGRKRLAAATAAGLSDVPCLLYEADDAKAKALAEADNLREPEPVDQSPFTGTERLREVLRAVAAELTPLQSSATLLRRTPTKSFQHRVAADLMVAQAWRAGWLVKATAIGLGDPIESRSKPLHHVIDVVKAAFEAEARVSALRLEFAVAPNAASFSVDEDFAVVAIAGGIFATLAWLQDIEEPRVELHADVPHPGTLKIEIVQRMAPVSADAVDALQDPCASGAGDLMAALGLQALKTLAVEHGGTFQVSPMSGRGTLIQATISKR